MHVNIFKNICEGMHSVDRSQYFIQFERRKSYNVIYHMIKNNFFLNFDFF